MRCVIRMLHLNVNIYYSTWSRTCAENISLKEANNMEMCYDGALVMPSNCVVMNSEEMEYVDGGWGMKEAKAAVLAALAGAIGFITKKAVSATMVKVVIGLCGSAIIATVDAAIITAFINPALAGTCALAAATSILIVGANYGIW